MSVVTAKHTRGPVGSNSTGSSSAPSSDASSASSSTSPSVPSSASLLCHLTGAYGSVTPATSHDGWMGRLNMGAYDTPPYTAGSGPTAVLQICNPPPPGSSPLFPPLPPPPAHAYARAAVRCGRQMIQLHRLQPHRASIRYPTILFDLQNNRQQQRWLNSTRCAPLWQPAAPPSWQPAS